MTPVAEQTDKLKKSSALRAVNLNKSLYTNKRPALILLTSNRSKPSSVRRSV